MYESMINLNTEQLNTLRTLRDQLTFSSNIVRLGVNGANNPSVYEISRWKDWNRSQKLSFKSCFSENDLNTAIIGWFVKYPADNGFLDQMNAWIDSKVAGTVIAYALEDDQNIWINSNEIIVSSGQGIKFSLKNLHEIKKQDTNQSWACLMCLI